MKINDNGQELETITEGYWPEGVALVMCDVIGQDLRYVNNAFCLHEGVAFYTKNGVSRNTAHWRYWAVLPPKPAPRRLTNREVGELCKKGWDIQYGSSRVFYGAAMVSAVDIENDPCDIEVRKLRAPGSDEWLEPTTDLLEGAEW